MTLYDLTTILMGLEITVIIALLAMVYTILENKWKN